MTKRFTTAIVVLVAAIGIVFVSLDILDIAEDFRIHLPTPILDTVFISAVAFIVAGVVAKDFKDSVATGPRPLLWLGCATLVFGTGSLVKGWTVIANQNIPITVYEITTLLSAIFHLIGSGLIRKRQHPPETESGRKRGSIFLLYTGVLVITALIILLVHQDVFPPFHTRGSSTTLIRSVFTAITIIIFFVTSGIYLKFYLKWQMDFLYWYSLGLLLFAFGTIFLSQASIESRLFWWGKASIYAGSIYLLIAATRARRYRLHLIFK